MKVYIAIVCAMASIAWARPEPPVNQYLPPAGNYATTREDSFAPPPGALSDTYGAPARAYSTPSSTYGAPARAFSSPSSTYGAPASAARTSFSFSRGSSKGLSRAGGLSRVYGAPAAARTGAIFNSAPASTYGAPASTYGAPASTYGAPAGQYAAAPAPVYGVPGYARYNPAEDDLSEPANYQFTYEVQDAASGSEFGHLESRQEDAAWGSYNVLLPDGRKQIVEYEADQGGFRPMIRYEEPQAGYGRGAGGPY